MKDFEPKYKLPWYTQWLRFNVGIDASYWPTTTSMGYMSLLNGAGIRYTAEYLYGDTLGQDRLVPKDEAIAGADNVRLDNLGRSYNPSYDISQTTLHGDALAYYRERFKEIIARHERGEIFLESLEPVVKVYRLTYVGRPVYSFGSLTDDTCKLSDLKETLNLEWDDSCEFVKLDGPRGYFKLSNEDVYPVTITQDTGYTYSGENYGLPTSTTTYGGFSLVEVTSLFGEYIDASVGDTFYLLGSGSLFVNCFDRNLKHHGSHRLVHVQYGSVLAPTPGKPYAFTLNINVSGSVTATGGNACVQFSSDVFTKLSDWIALQPPPEGSSSAGYYVGTSALGYATAFKIVNKSTLALKLYSQTSSASGFSSFQFYVPASVVEVYDLTPRHQLDVTPESGTSRPGGVTRPVVFKRFEEHQTQVLFYQEHPLAMFEREGTSDVISIGIPTVTGQLAGHPLLNNGFFRTPCTPIYYLDGDKRIDNFNGRWNRVSPLAVVKDLLSRVGANTALTWLENEIFKPNDILSVDFFEAPSEVHSNVLVLAAGAHDSTTLVHVVDRPFADTSSGGQTGQAEYGRGFSWWKAGLVPDDELDVYIQANSGVSYVVRSGKRVTSISSEDTPTWFMPVNLTDAATVPNVTSRTPETGRTTTSIVTSSESTYTVEWTRADLDEPWLYTSYFNNAATVTDMTSSSSKTGTNIPGYSTYYSTRVTEDLHVVYVKAEVYLFGNSWVYVNGELKTTTSYFPPRYEPPAGIALTVYSFSETSGLSPENSSTTAFEVDFFTNPICAISYNITYTGSGSDITRNSSSSTCLSSNSSNNETETASHQYSYELARKIIPPGFFTKQYRSQTFDDSPQPTYSSSGTIEACDYDCSGVVSGGGSASWSSSSRYSFDNSYSGLHYYNFVEPTSVPLDMLRPAFVSSGILSSSLEYKRIEESLSGYQTTITDCGSEVTGWSSTSSTESGTYTSPDVGMARDFVNPSRYSWLMNNARFGARYSYTSSASATLFIIPYTDPSIISTNSAFVGVSTQLHSTLGPIIGYYRDGQWVDGDTFEFKEPGLTLVEAVDANNGILVARLFATIAPESTVAGYSFSPSTSSFVYIAGKPTTGLVVDGRCTTRSHPYWNSEPVKLASGFNVTSGLAILPDGTLKAVRGVTVSQYLPDTSFAPGRLVARRIDPSTFSQSVFLTGPSYEGDIPITLGKTTLPAGLPNSWIIIDTLYTRTI